MYIDNFRFTYLKEMRKPMTVYEYVIIGFGKAGKTFASFLASQGIKTALIEKSKERYGGTCINVACIPSKSLEYSARLSHGR